MLQTTLTILAITLWAIPSIAGILWIILWNLPEETLHRLQDAMILDKIIHGTVLAGITEIGLIFIFAILTFAS